jgi:hypothetical protein
MKRAFLVVLLAWPPGVTASPSRDAEGGSLRATSETVQLPVAAAHRAANRGLARFEGITWSEPVYRYGGREPTLEELPVTRRSAEPGSEAATRLQPPH